VKLTRSALEKIEKENEIIKKGKERGFITYDDIIKIFPDLETDITFLDELSVSRSGKIFIMSS
jgi:predicted phage gp36 major capsid-like protein